jgi:hypothetical protein
MGGAQEKFKGSEIPISTNRMGYVNQEFRDSGLAGDNPVYRRAADRNASGAVAHGSDGRVVITVTAPSRTVKSSRNPMHRRPLLLPQKGLSRPVSHDLQFRREQWNCEARRLN